jgi:hypothetical protein
MPNSRKRTLNAQCKPCRRKSTESSCYRRGPDLLGINIQSSIPPPSAGHNPRDDGSHAAYLGRSHFGLCTARADIPLDHLAP